MLKPLQITLMALLLFVATSVLARSAAEVRKFKQTNPCPATGETRGKCPGYVVDHIAPLCAGGADDPSNMQWQALAESKLKDKEERRYCRVLRKLSIDNQTK